MNIDKDLKATTYSRPSAPTPEKIGSHHHHHYYLLCQQFVGQHIELEMIDVNIYHGRLHTYDKENMYMVMPMRRDDSEDSRLFPNLAGGVSPGYGLYGFPFDGIRRFRPFW
ncbi:hypothetical protein [Fictibacillus terranigra]|uniref:Uncharacterized protein n=1 Tax=Fictibacillus terranigra TaxID=3058424 RepID=A0ABT8ECF8_9BACL|nr:hypothetical protein [Fictibacillus sp. CENA-BCM004]MDN4075552.1 hypothetical protein [Fictibacillus sp. CENA-BCM004]